MKTIPSGPAKFVAANRALRLFTGLLLLAAGPWAQAAIELNSVMVVADQTQVGLLDTVSGDSQWVSVGGSFHGYQVTSYDAKTDQVVLTKGSLQVRVRLNGADIKTLAATAQPAAPAAPKQKIKLPPAAEQVVTDNLQKILEASYRYSAANGGKTATFADLAAADPSLASLPTADGEQYSAVYLKPGDNQLEITTASGAKVKFETPKPPKAPKPAAGG